MSDKAQRRLLSLLAVVIFLALDRSLKKFVVAETVPERRGPSEDVAEAVLQGAARMAAVIVASTLVRGLAERQR